MAQEKDWGPHAQGETVLLESSYEKEAKVGGPLQTFLCHIQSLFKPGLQKKKIQA